MTSTLSHAPRFQLATAETWANPWPMYRALRDHDPVHHVVPPSKPEDDYYVLTRHADIWAAARDHETFSSAQGPDRQLRRPGNDWAARTIHRS